MELGLLNLQNKEHKSWIMMCDKLTSILKITKEEFNSNPEIRVLAILIEKWGYDSAMLRVKLNDFEKRGLLWKGEDN
jgi:hypothetical protein